MVTLESILFFVANISAVMISVVGFCTAFTDFDAEALPGCICKRGDRQETRKSSLCFLPSTNNLRILWRSLWVLQKKFQCFRDMLLSVIAQSCYALLPFCCRTLDLVTSSGLYLILPHQLELYGSSTSSSIQDSLFSSQLLLYSLSLLERSPVYRSVFRVQPMFAQGCRWAQAKPEDWNPTTPARRTGHFLHARLCLRPIALSF